MKSKVISIRLNEDELALLEEMTCDIGVKVSDYIRACLKMVTDYRYYKAKQEYENDYENDIRSEIM